MFMVSSPGRPHRIICLLNFQIPCYIMFVGEGYIYILRVDLKELKELHSSRLSVYKVGQHSCLSRRRDLFCRNLSMFFLANLG